MPEARPVTAETTGEGETFTCARCATGFTGGDACPICGLLLAPVPCGAAGGGPARSRCVLCGTPACGEDADPGADDGTRAARCGVHRTVPVIEGWAQVYSTHTDIEARLIAQNLEAEGLPAQVYAQRDHAFPVDLGELAIVRVLVPAWEFPRAQALIEAYKDDEGEVVFACPACGEVYEPGAETCARCGARLSGAAAR